MRIADVDFILIPEWLARPTTGKPDDDHWISRWQRNLATAGWLDAGECAPAECLLAQTAPVEADRPIIIVTHGHGIDVLLDAHAELAVRPVVGAFIVAPSPAPGKFRPDDNGLQKLAFPSIVIASDDHPEFHPGEAQELAGRLGSTFVAAGPSGRIDASSGQGPWPEGLMRLGWFLKQLTVH
jgi:predicted alpha/beta hydrolase family esterase